MSQKPTAWDDPGDWDIMPQESDPRTWAGADEARRELRQIPEGFGITAVYLELSV
jgi:hypothetical protein